MDTKNTPAPVKKQWQKPMIYILATANVNTGSHDAHHENSIHVTPNTFTGAPTYNFGATPGGRTKIQIDYFVSS